MKHLCFALFFFAAVLFVTSSLYAASTMNIHWVPNVNPGQGATAHASTTVSGNIWMNVVNTDNNSMTIDTINIQQAWYQENAHSASQVNLSMTNSSTCPLCAGTGIAVKSMDPSVIFTLTHNASYTFHVAGTVRHTLMYPPWTYTDETLDLTQTVTANGQLLTQYPDLTVAWDPDRMSDIDLPSTWSDEQLGKCTLTYNIYSALNQACVRTIHINSKDRPGNHTWTWDGKDTLGTTCPSGIYSISAHVMADSPTSSSDYNRSANLSISNVSAIGRTDIFDTDYAGVTVQYTLADSLGRAASECEVQAWGFVFDSNTNSHYWTIIGEEDGPLALGTNQVNMDLLRSAVASVEGSIVFIVRARDSDSDYDKGHRNRWALESGASIYNKILDVPYFPQPDLSM